jgi:hypothetical protein
VACVLILPAESPESRKQSQMSHFTTVLKRSLVFSFCVTGCLTEEATEPEVATTESGVLGPMTWDVSCHPADIPELARAFTYGQVAANSAAFAQCVATSLTTYNQAGMTDINIGPYRACSADPAGVSAGTVLATARSLNPITFTCDYSAIGTSRGGDAFVKQVPLGDSTTSTTINLGNVLGDLPHVWNLVGQGVFVTEAVLAGTPSRLDIFGQGTDMAYYHQVGIGGALESLGHKFIGPPAVAWQSPGRLDLVGQGTNGWYYRLQQVNDVWSPLEGLPMAGFGAATLFTPLTGAINIVVEGTDHQGYFQSGSGAGLGAVMGIPGGGFID